MQISFPHQSFIAFQAGFKKTEDRITCRWNVNTVRTRPTVTRDRKRTDYSNIYESCKQANEKKRWEN